MSMFNVTDDVLRDICEDSPYEVSKTVLLKTERDNIVLIMKEDAPLTFRLNLVASLKIDCVTDLLKDTECLDNLDPHPSVFTKFDGTVFNFIDDGYRHMYVNDMPTYNVAGFPILIDSSLAIVNFDETDYLNNGVVVDQHASLNSEFKDADLIMANPDIEKLYVTKYDTIGISNTLDNRMTADDTKDKSTGEVTEDQSSEETNTGLINLSSGDMSIDIDVKCYVSIDSVQCPCVEKGNGISSLTEHKFEQRLHLPDNDGVVLVALTPGGPKEVFIRDTTMNYEHHKRPTFTPINLGYGEGTVEDLEKEVTLPEAKRFEMDTLGHALFEVEAAGELNSIIASVRDTQRKANIIGLAKAEINVPLFVMDSEKDAQVIKSIEKFNVNRKTEGLSLRALSLLTLGRTVSGFNHMVGSRLTSLVEDEVNLLFKEIGINERLDNVLDNLETMKRMIGATGKAKLFIHRLAEIMDCIQFSIEEDLDTGSLVLWMDKRTYVSDLEIEFDGSLGRVNPNISPDTYRDISRSLISIGGTAKSILVTTRDPSIIIEAYRREIETGIGDAGVQISRIIKV